MGNFMLSEHFSFDELCRSQVADANKVGNVPVDPCIIANLTRLCNLVLEPFRSYLGSPVYISSGYRSSLVNKLVGGVKNSNHLLGLAADIRCKDYDEMNCFYDIFKELSSNVPIDELIREHTFTSNWIHVSVKRLS